MFSILISGKAACLSSYTLGKHLRLNCFQYCISKWLYHGCYLILINCDFINWQYSTLTLPFCNFNWGNGSQPRITISMIVNAILASYFYICNTWQSNVSINCIPWIINFLFQVNIQTVNEVHNLLMVNSTAQIIFCSCSLAARCCNKGKDFSLKVNHHIHVF